jgi:hypothetical protein
MARANPTLRCGRGGSLEFTAMVLGVAEFARPICDFVERGFLCRGIARKY